MRQLRLKESSKKEPLEMQNDSRESKKQLRLRGFDKRQKILDKKLNGSKESLLDSRWRKKQN